MSDMTVPKERLVRIADVLGSLAGGITDFHALKIDVQDSDDFATFEEVFNNFVEQFAQMRAENEKLNEARLETIARQQLAINDLSVPIIDVWQDIVMLPVVGIVDTQRSVQMTQRLLSRVANGGAACVIIDLTGVDVVDTATADHLIRMLRSVQLLGSTCVISGISPNVAQTLVQLEINLTNTAIVRNLREALKTCFRYLEAARTGSGTSSATGAVPFVAPNGANGKQTALGKP
jgi:rsbT co-antagonist protein RsbR